jgi:NADH:ubiquinone oxidoreductase subunit 2 (subunit N)
VLREPLILVSPLLIYIAAAGLGTLLFSQGFGSPAMPRLLLLAQLATLPIVFVLIAAMPTRENTDHCPDFANAPLLRPFVYVTVIGSCLLGGSAVAAAISIKRERPRSTAGFVVVSLAVAFATLVMALSANLCGTSN